MRLNHVDLQVSDIPVAARFFETFFGLRKVYQREGQIAILEDETGFCFGLSNLHNSPAPVYPVDFHVGFILENRNQVRTVYQRVRDAGIAIRFDLQEAGPNFVFQCVGPDNILVEVRAPK